MFRKIAVVLGFIVIALASAPRVYAACSVPVTLANGTTADATQVMTNFTSLAGCAAPIASPSFTGNVAMSGNATVSGKIGAGGSPSADIQVTADATFNVDTDSQFSIKGVSNPNQVLMLGYDTSADHGYVQSVRRGYNATPLYLNPNGASGGTIVIPILANCNPIKADSGGTLNCSSDERLKDIQSHYTAGLAVIDRINPIIYDWKPSSGLTNTSPVLGFSAQNVQRVIPYAVSTDTTGHLKLDQEGILAASVNAIKELHNQVRALARTRETAGTQTGMVTNSAEAKIVTTLTSAMRELKAANDTQAAEIAVLETRVDLLQQKLRVQTAQK